MQIPADFHYALRGLIKRPLFALVVGVTLSLGIGGNAIIFSVVNAVVLQLLPFRDADRLVHIFEARPRGMRYQRGGDQAFLLVRPGTLQDWAARTQTLSSLAGLPAQDCSADRQWATRIGAGARGKRELLPDARGSRASRTHIRRLRLSGWRPARHSERRDLAHSMQRLLWRCPSL
jgi:hypothetical protein